MKERAPMENGTVILKRTFNQKDLDGNFIKFWRVIGPKTHRRLESDLSIEGLIEAGIILQNGKTVKIMAYSPTNY